jgi:hypothetical protein
MGRCHTALGEHALSVSAVHSMRILSGEAWALPAGRGVDSARQGAGGARCGRRWAALGLGQGEAAAGRDDGTHARATGTARAVALGGPWRCRIGGDCLMGMASGTGGR